MIINDKKWLSSHFEEIVDKYAGKYVLIINQRVYPVNEDNIVKIESELRKKYKRSPIGLPVPRPEEFTHILAW